MTSNATSKEEQQALPYAGRFVWHDLMSTDPAAAKAFYTRLFGWSCQERDMGPEIGTYTMWSAAGSDIGGLVPLDPGHGAPSHWISYVTVDDVEATTERVKELGGRVPVSATDIPGVGRFAVILDPQGAAISPFRYEDREGAGGVPPELDGLPPVGHFCWYQVNARDLASAADFYASIFGWGVVKTRMEGVGPYYLFHRGSQEVGSGMEIPKGPEGVETPGHWIAYVRVADAEATEAEARKLGAEVYVGTTEVPGIGRFAVLADPTGASFALWEDLGH